LPNQKPGFSTVAPIIKHRRAGVAEFDVEIIAINISLGTRERSVPEMPFKSQAQRRKFAELLVKGKISNETFEEWNRETGSAKLPERVKPKRKSKSKSKRKTTPKRRR
jgi:hypothetical protein